MVSSLTQADVARLLAEPSASVRAEVADKLAREIDSASLTETELRLAQDIVCVMARDVELTVRRALSENLRRAKHLPHDVAVQLAHDVEAVALPILYGSPVLTDADLIEQFDHKGDAGQFGGACGNERRREDALQSPGADAARGTIMLDRNCTHLHLHCL